MPEREDVLAQEHKSADDGDADQEKNESVLDVRLSLLTGIAESE